MYSLVEFESTGDLGAVPSKWIQRPQECDVCYWPPKSILSAIKTCKEPNPSTWKKHNVKVISSFKTYKEARKAEQMGQYNMDANLESEENLGRGKRKKFQKHLLGNSEGSLSTIQNKSLRQNRLHVGKTNDAPEGADERITQNIGEADGLPLRTSDCCGMFDISEEVEGTKKPGPEDETSGTRAPSECVSGDEADQNKLPEENGTSADPEFRETVVLNGTSGNGDIDLNESCVESNMNERSCIDRSLSETGISALSEFRELSVPTKDGARKKAIRAILTSQEIDVNQAESIIVGNKIYILKKNESLPSDTSGPQKQHQCCYSTEILERLVEEVACLRREVGRERMEVINPLSKLVNSPELLLQQGLPVILPLQSVFEIEHFEEELLLDQRKRKQLVENIVKVGGDTVEDVVKRVLRGLFTIEAASNYSWEGRKSKRELKGMMLMSLIFAALQTGYVLEYADMSLVNIKHKINEWFQYCNKIYMRRWREKKKRKIIDAPDEEPMMIKISEVRTEKYDNDIDIIETAVKIEQDSMDFE